MSAPREQWRLSAPTLRHWVGGVGCVQSMPSKPPQAHFVPRVEASILVRWDDRREGAAVVNVIGPLTRARVKSFASPSRYVRFSLRAGCARLVLGVPVSAVVDRVVPIEEVWGESGARLGASLRAGSLPDAIAHVERAILARLHASDSPRLPSDLLIHALRSLDLGAGRVAKVARDLGVSERHLRRLFQDDVGMTPKRYARIARLRRVLARGAGSPWVDLASDGGFHDQAHLIREFHDLLQVTPGAFRARGRPVSR